AQVNVQAQAGSKTIVHPVQVTVPSGGVSWVQVGGSASAAPECPDDPKGIGYVLLVQSDSDAPIVAQTISRFDGSGDSTIGAATSVGSTLPARQWVIPRTRVLGQRSTSIALSDPGLQPAQVAVAIVHGGHVDRPAALQQLKITPGDRVVPPLGAQRA